MKIKDMVEELEKAGKKDEGSKGGKIIGHTKSGKPIYESKNVEHALEQHPKFSINDHEQARTYLAGKAGEQVHPKRMGKEGAEDKYKYWDEQAGHHVVAKMDKQITKLPSEKKPQEKMKEVAKKTPTYEAKNLGKKVTIPDNETKKSFDDFVVNELTKGSKAPPIHTPKKVKVKKDPLQAKQEKQQKKRQMQVLGIKQQKKPSMYSKY